MPEPALAAQIGRAGNVKGSTLLSTLAYVDHRFGDGARKKLVAALEPDDRVVVTGIVLPISWYPLPLFARTLRALEATFGNGDLSVVTERGRWTAVNDMHTIRRALVKLVTPDWVFNKATGLWSQFHDTGSWSTRKLGPKSELASLRGLGVVDPALCASIRGWILGLGDLTRSKCHVRHSRCRATGAASCEYTVDWV